MAGKLSSSFQEQSKTADRPQSIEALEQIAKANGKVQVELSRSTSPLSRLAASGGDATDGGPALQITPYIIWLENQSMFQIEVKLHWAQHDVPLIQATGGIVYPGQVAPFQIGTTGCAGVAAYILEIFHNGTFQGSTGTVFPNAADGYQCSDAYGVA